MAEPLSTVDLNADAEFVRSCLTATKRTVKLIEVGSAAMMLAAYTLLTLTVVVIADHLLAQGLSAEARRAARWVYSVGAIALLAWLAVVPLVRRINDLFAAWVIEHHHPEFKNSLISALQLAWRRELPGSVRTALTARAAGDLSLVDVRRTVDTRSARRAGLVAGGAALVFLIYAALAPKPIMPSIRRALGLELPPPTRTQIVVEEPPADYVTFVGSPVRMIARVEGKRPSEAYVQFSLDGGASWLPDQRLALSPPPTGRTVDPREHRRWRAVKSGRDVQQTMHYQFIAGDGRSEVRLLRVCPYPSVARVTVRYEYPPYTRLAPREVEGGNVDGLVGTLISVRIRTSVPADSPPTLTFRKTDRGTLRSYALDEGGQDFLGRFRIAADDEYTIDYQDQGGTRNADTVVYTVLARPDQPPLIELRQPDDNITLSASDALELACDASDDFGLTEAMLEYQIDERKGRVTPVASPPAETRSLPIAGAIPLSRLAVSPGDRITWWVSVKDNRCNVRNEPAYQSTESERRHIEVRQDPPPRVGQRAPAATRAVGEGRQAEPQTSRPLIGRPGELGEDPSASTQRAVQTPASGEGATTRSAPVNSQPSESMEEFVKVHRRELELLKKHLTDGHPEGDRPEAASQKPGAPQVPAEGRREGGKAANDQPPTADTDRSADSSKGTQAGSEDQQAVGQRDQQQGPRDGPSQAKPDRSPSPSQAKPDAGSPGAREQGAEEKSDGAPQATQPSTEGGQKSAGPAENKDGQSSSQDKATQSQPSQGGDRQSSPEGSERPAGKPDQSSKPSNAGPQGQSAEQGGQKDAGGQKQDQKGSPSQEKGDAGSPGQEGEGEGEGEKPPNGGDQGVPGAKGQPGESQAQAQDQRSNQGQGDGQGKDGSQGKGRRGEPSDKSSSGNQTPPGAEGASSEPGQQESNADNQDNGRQKDSPGQGQPAAGQQQPQAVSGTPKQAEGDKAATNSQTGGGASDGIKGSGPVPSGPTTRGAVEYEVPETDAPDRGSSRLPTVDRTEQLVNELERELRRGEPDPNMLKDLGWTPEEARRFVREFRRADRGSPTTQISSRGVQEVALTPASRPGEERLRTAAGRDTSIRTRDTVDRRDPDTIHRLLEVRRQQVGEDYRELLEEYYKTVAGRRIATPSSRPGGR